MSNISFSSVAIKTSIALVILCMNASAAQKKFIQDRFAIGFWVDPPADNNMDQHYADIAAANFTTVIGGFGARTPETIAKQIALYEKYDLKAIVYRAGLQPEKLPESSAVWGYMIRDEPSSAHFSGLRDAVDKLREARPGKLAYINLLPNYANAKQLGAPSYDKHVERFVTEVGVDVLSMDHYPMMRPDSDGRSRYCENLDVMRRFLPQV